MSLNLENKLAKTVILYLRKSQGKLWLLENLQLQQMTHSFFHECLIFTVKHALVHTEQPGWLEEAIT